MAENECRNFSNTGYLWQFGLLLLSPWNTRNSICSAFFNTSECSHSRRHSLPEPNQTTDRFLKWRKKSLFWLFTLLVLCSYRARWCVAYISCHFIGSCSFCNNARDMRTQVSSLGSLCDFALSFTVCFLVLSLFHLFCLESVIDIFHTILLLWLCLCLCLCMSWFEPFTIEPQF